ITLPHACGTGTCGTCKFKVDKGIVSEIPNSIPGITRQEIDAGYTLACQCKPKENITISEYKN
ncbi:MAG: hypothetical protein DRQ47_04555, partial [Gammaproteobacteria bacterium]